MSSYSTLCRIHVSRRLTSRRSPRMRSGPSSGLAYKVLRPGTGTVHPRKESRVTVHYTGWSTDGKMFDSSVVRGSRGDLRPRRSHPGVDRGRAVDGGRREDAFLGSGKARVSRPPGSARASGLRHRSSCHQVRTHMNDGDRALTVLLGGILILGLLAGTGDVSAQNARRAA